MRGQYFVGFAENSSGGSGEWGVGSGEREMESGEWGPELWTVSEDTDDNSQLRHSVLPSP